MNYPANFDMYTYNVAFKDVRDGQSFIADGLMLIKLNNQCHSNAKEVISKRYRTITPNSIVAVHSNRRFL